MIKREQGKYGRGENERCRERRLVGGKAKEFNERRNGWMEEWLAGKKESKVGRKE